MTTKTSKIPGFLLFLFHALSFLMVGAQTSDTICIAPIEIDNTLLNVFPNPTQSTFQIVYASNTSCPPPGWGGLLLINIINKNGKTVFSESVEEFEGEYIRTIDLTGHERGVYIIEIVAGKQKLVKREILD